MTDAQGNTPVFETTDSMARREALHQAVQARHTDEDPSSTVQRAEEFYRFLSGDGEDDAA